MQRLLVLRVQFSKLFFNEINHLAFPDNLNQFFSCEEFLLLLEGEIVARHCEKIIQVLLLLIESRSIVLLSNDCFCVLELLHAESAQNVKSRLLFAVTLGIDRRFFVE